MKILYVSQYFPPEMGAPSARAAELSRHWAAAGHDVTVLTGFPNHPTGVVPPEYQDKFRRLIAHEQTDGVNVVRTWLLPFPNRKAYERMLNYSSFCASAATTGLFLSRPDVVIASSPQMLVAVSGWWLAQWKRVPFVFEVRDLWPESLAAVGMSDGNSLLHRSLARIAGFLYRHADRIVVVAPAFEDYLVEHWRVPREKISVIENGVETELFAPEPFSAEAAALRKELDAEGKFVVSYIGTMGMAHGLETIIAAAVQLQTTNPEIVFLMLGEGAEKEHIVALAQQRGLNNLRFVDQQPRERIPAYISASDVCLVPLKKTDLFKTVIPTKMLEFMSCARPVILGVDGQARAILEEARGGLVIEPENSDALVSAIRYLTANREAGLELGQNGRGYIVRKFSRSNTAEKYILVLKHLLNLSEPRGTELAA
ncbi:MAG TPA: glycosyltransferase family 4 protein [Candidatus Sulfotelmatobacter sp.]|jgi:colanic acid biosynthesis glycosyl transferase WcaI|nr:glycosyltransferase family 4 protein [Candidatus Sulfotelmatobacter sp.]